MKATITLSLKEYDSMKKKLHDKENEIKFYQDGLNGMQDIISRFMIKSSDTGKYELVMPPRKMRHFICQYFVEPFNKK